MSNDVVAKNKVVFMTYSVRDASAEEIKLGFPAEQGAPQQLQ